MRMFSKDFLVKQFGLICGLVLMLGAISAGAAENYAVVVAVRANDNSDVSVLFYLPINDDGSFGEQMYVNWHYTNISNAVTGVADFDNDGDYDVIFASGWTQEIFFYRKAALGPVFSQPQVVATFDMFHQDTNSIYGAGEIAVADYNDDGNMDFLLSGYNNKLQVFLGNGDGTFNLPIVQILPTNGVMLGKGAADMNCDGIIDVVTAVQFGDYFEHDGIYVWLGNGDGSFQVPTQSIHNGTDVWDSVGFRPFGYGVVIDDYTCDGMPDIVVTVEAHGGQSSMDIIAMTGICDPGSVPTFDAAVPFDDGTYAYRYLFADSYSLDGNSGPNIFYSKTYEWSSSDFHTIEGDSESCGQFVGSYISHLDYAYEIGAVATPKQIINCTDADSDGFPIEPECGVVDCDDSDPSVYPGAFEITYNGKDDDCNPATLDDDLDGDGFVG